MMLKIYSTNLRPTLGMFKTTLKRNFGIMAIISIGVLLICPGYLLSKEELSNSAAQLMIYLLGFVGCSSVLLFNFVNLSFLYKKPSADVFFALPIKRSGLLLSRAIAGLIFSVLPVTLGYLGLFICNGAIMDTKMDMIITAYLATLAFMAVCSAFSLIFVVSAGSGFDLGLSFLGVNLGSIFFGLILYFIFSSCLLGYPQNVDNFELSLFSPFIYFGSLLITITRYSLAEGQLLAYYLVCLALFLIFGALSLILFKRRKSEKGGDAYAFKFLYIICTLLISFSGGFLTGYIFSDNKINTMFWIFSAVGAILVAIVYGAISNRGFKGLKSSIVTSVSSVLIMAVITSVASTGGFGYKSYIPKAEEVKRVEAVVDGEETVFNDPTPVLKAHNDILEKQLYNKTSPFSTYFNVKYELKNGDTVMRQYYLNPTKSEELLAEIIFSEEHFNTVLQDIKESPVNEDWIYVNEDTSYRSIINRKERLTLINLYKEELKGVKDLLTLKQENCYIYQISYSRADEAIAELNQGRYRTVRLLINNQFPKTNEYINELGLKSRMEADIETY